LDRIGIVYSGGNCANTTTFSNAHADPYIDKDVHPHAYLHIDTLPDIHSNRYAHADLNEYARPISNTNHYTDLHAASPDMDTHPVPHPRADLHARATDRYLYTHANLYTGSPHGYFYPHAYPNSYSNAVTFPVCR
jgi:hypothetical protein